MPELNLLAPWKRLWALLAEGNADRVRRFLRELPPGEIARTISRMGERARQRLLTLLGPREAAEVLDHLPEAQAVDILEELPADRAAAIVDYLPSDEQADLLGELEDEAAEEILARMAPEEASDARRLLAYAPDTAGGVMITEYVAFGEAASVEAVVTDLREHGGRYSDLAIQYVYITDAEDRLKGVLRLRDLLLAPPGTAVRTIMIPRPQSVPADTPLDQLKQFFDDHAFVGVPVTDPSGRLVGLVRRASVEEAIGDRATEAFLSVSGLQGEEELRSMPMLYRARRRLSWLSINVVLNVLAASVIAAYQDTLAAVIALAVFLPIISDMSGCSGNQAVAVSIRELTLGLVRPYEFARVVVKEGAVGLLNGLVLGLLLAAVAVVWRGNAWLGLVVGLALMINTLIAVVLGGLVPLALKAARQDPALASGPILTTVTDMCGFFLVLSLASALLPRLVA